MAVQRHTVRIVGLSGTVVIYLGMRVRRPRGMLRLLGLGQFLRDSGGSRACTVMTSPDGRRHGGGLRRYQLPDRHGAAVLGLTVESDAAALSGFGVNARFGDSVCAEVLPLNGELDGFIAVRTEYGPGCRESALTGVAQ